MSYPRWRRSQLALALAAGLFAAPLWADEAAVLNTAIWWIPGEAGWGLYTVDQGDFVAPTWYTFDADGEPTWFLVPGAFPQEDGSYVGEVWRFTGVPLQQIDGPPIETENKVGDAVLRFRDDGKLEFSYQIGATEQSKLLEKFPLPKNVVCRASETPSRATATNYTDLWYSESSSGWGLNITHVDDATLVVTWYTYDTDREPVFLTAVTEREQAGDFVGQLFREVGGTPFDQIDGAEASEGSEVIGEVRLHFSDGETADFSYRLGDEVQTKRITRLQIGSVAAVCEAQPLAGGGGGGEPGADECYPPLAVGDRYRLRDNSGGEINETDVEVIGTGTLDGHPVFQVRYRPVTQSAGEVIEFIEQTATERIHYGSDGFIPEVNASGTTRFNPPVRVPRSTPVGAQGRLLYQAITNYTANGQSVRSVIDFDETYHRVGSESVTVPAGSFSDACRFETTLKSDVSVGAAGFTVRTQVDGRATQWAHPSIGAARTQSSATSTATTSGAPFPIPPTVTESSSVSEIVSGQIGGRDFP